MTSIKTSIKKPTAAAMLVAAGAVAFGGSVRRRTSKCR